MLEKILMAFNLSPDTAVTPYGTGLINHTWEVRSEKGHYILQQINGQVFAHPSLIAENIEMVAGYLADQYPDAVFPRPVKALSGQSLVEDDKGNYFRLYPFIAGSITIDVAHTPLQAFEAAKKFGEFTRMLSGFPTERLHETLPDFHNLSLRYKAFREALEKGIPERIRKADQLIAYLESQNHLVKEYERITRDPAFKRRVTHHDTKISNVLFDKQGKGICVIDLDTLMPGYFISDVGDMLRTYLSPVSEEEKDTRLITVRMDYFHAIVEGYMKEMQNELTLTEKDHFVYAGAFMMYMQALRFLTDFLIGDLYYGRRYEDHNFVRAVNQATLLRVFQEKTSQLRTIA